MRGAAIGGAEGLRGVELPDHPTGRRIVGAEASVHVACQHGARHGSDRGGDAGFAELTTVADVVGRRRPQEFSGGDIERIEAGL